MKAMINLICHANSKKTLLIAGLAFALTACGGGSDGTAATTTTGGGSTPVPESNEALASRLAAGIDAGTISEAAAVAQLLAAGF